MTIPTWSDIVAFLTASFGVGGIALRQQRIKGAQEQKMSEIEKIVGQHISDLSSHTATLAQHEGSFKVIDTKLDYISKAIDKLTERQ